MYDQHGRIVDIKTDHSHTQFTYDAVGQLIEETQHYQLPGFNTSMRWQHEYDELGSRIRTIRPDGQVEDVLRYGSGHLHGMLWNQDELLSIERNDMHAELTRHYHNGVSQALDYAKMGRITVQRIQRGGGERTRHYEYLNNGLVSKLVDSHANSVNYRYMADGYLEQAERGRLNERFDFDPAGNPIEPVFFSIVVASIKPLFVDNKV